MNVLRCASSNNANNEALLNLMLKLSSVSTALVRCKFFSWKLTPTCYRTPPKSFPTLRFVFRYDGFIFDYCSGWMNLSGPGSAGNCRRDAFLKRKFPGILSLLYYPLRKLMNSGKSCRDEHQCLLSRACPVQLVAPCSSSAPQGHFCCSLQT